jgi:ubiquitin-protein ligase
MKQVTVLLIDTSGTMTSVVPELRQRKLTAALDLVEQFWRAVETYRPESLFGLGTFPSDGKILFGRSKLTPRSELKARGRASLWPKISSAIDAILAIPNSQLLVKRRILVITDGEDASAAERLEVCNKLAKNSIVLDAIILPSGTGNSAEPFEHSLKKSIFPLCELTSGCAIVASSLEFPLFQREDFVDLSLRGTDPRQDPPIDPRDLRVPDSFKVYGLPPFDINVKLQANLPRPEQATFRDERIALEFRNARDAGFHVYAVDGNTEGAWRAFVPGREGLWHLSVTFPGDYPFVPPVLRVAAKLDGDWVGSRGRVTNLPGYKYTPGMRVSSILTKVQQQLANAPKGDLADIECMRRLHRQNPWPVVLRVDANRPSLDPCDADFVVSKLPHS